MGLFDKIKKLSGNLNADNVRGMLDSVNPEDITKHVTSVTDSMAEKIESVSDKDLASGVNSIKDSVTEKIESVHDKDLASGISSFRSSMSNKLTSLFEKVEKEDETVETTEYEEADEDEMEADEDDEELKARKKERNKKVAKGFAKGAMFVGSFLFAQKEGADSVSSLRHAFNRTKDLDDYMEGKNKGEGKKKEKNQSKEKQIKSIAHYEYICPKSHRGHNINVPNIDIPTVNLGTPTREEAVDAIMKATGVDRPLAEGIWNGGSSNAWHMMSYTYVNDGKLGGTVKCR
ncbi:MAG: hypothetical protein K2K52_08865 [Paramuribaculum sp.]|nr:hypothetical protein [Paramuribaculum sp.]